jgi:hypothetical protein
MASLLDFNSLSSVDNDLVITCIIKNEEKKYCRAGAAVFTDNVVDTVGHNGNMLVVFCRTQTLKPNSRFLGVALGTVVLCL